MIRIRLLSSPKPKWSDPRIEFDPEIPLDEADGLFVWGGMKPEFLNYHGTKAWFIDEPRTQSMFRLFVYRQALRQIEPHEFLHHSNPDPRYRFPCVTHYGELTRAHSPCRRDAAVAVVSNYGGRLWRVRDYVFGALAEFYEACPRRGVALRNQLILNPDVELYGNDDTWNRFRSWPWSKPGAPPNYGGPYPGSWLTMDHVGALAAYRTVVCLENAAVPHYFTEKFVNAARAGCVPVYHAHPSVRETFLRGAAWIDPEDYGFDADATLAAARNCDAEAIRQQNWAWLKSAQLKATNGWRIWSRIADYFVERVTAERRTSARKHRIAVHA